MKYSKLEQIVREEANRLKENAAHSGAWNDGGSANLLAKLSNFKQGLVVKYDLRPSEYEQLNNTDIGEPEEFLSIINRYKLKLAEQIAKDIEL
jgi:hypothetical protein